MEFQVPQFIEVEDKIFGPFTFKQFVYILGGLGLGFIVWNISKIILGNFIAIFPALIPAIFIGAFGFKIVHNRESFAQTVENAVHFFRKKKVFIWRKQPNEVKKGERSSDTLGNNENLNNLVPRLSDSKLKEISWGLDIQETLGDSAQDSIK